MNKEDDRITALRRQLEYYQDFHEHVKHENQGVMCEKECDPSTGIFNCPICWPENDEDHYSPIEDG